MAKDFFNRSVPDVSKEELLKGIGENALKSATQALQNSPQLDKIIELIKQTKKQNEDFKKYIDTIASKVSSPDEQSGNKDFVKKISAGVESLMSKKSKESVGPSFKSGSGIEKILIKSLGKSMRDMASPFEEKHSKMFETLFKKATDGHSLSVKDSVTRNVLKSILEQLIRTHKFIVAKQGPATGNDASINEAVTPRRRVSDASGVPGTGPNQQSNQPGASQQQPQPQPSTRSSVDDMLKQGGLVSVGKSLVRQSSQIYGTFGSGADDGLKELSSAIGNIPAASINIDDVNKFRQIIDNLSLFTESQREQIASIIKSKSGLYDEAARLRAALKGAKGKENKEEISQRLKEKQAEIAEVFKRDIIQQVGGFSGLIATKLNPTSDRFYKGILKTTNSLTIFGDRLSSVAKAVSMISPSNLGIIKTTSDISDPAKALKEGLTSGSEWLQDISAALYETMGATGSPLAGKGFIKEVAMSGQEILKINRTSDQLISGMSRSYFDMGNELRSIYDQTGATSDVVRKQYISNIKRGITEYSSLNRLTKQGLALGKIIGADAGQTADELADWNQYMDLNVGSTALLAKHVQHVGQSLGVSGDRLLQSVKGARQFAEAMRDAGNYSDEAAKNLIALNTAAQKYGTDKSIGSITESLTPGGYLLGGAENQALVAQAASMSGDYGMYDKILGGTFGKEQQDFKKIGEGIEKLANSFIQANAGNAAMASVQTKSAYGKGVGELLRMAKTLKEAGMTTDERMTEVKNVLSGTLSVQDRALKEAQLKQLEQVKKNEAFVGNDSKFEKMKEELTKIKPGLDKISSEQEKVITANFGGLKELVDDRRGKLGQIQGYRDIGEDAAAIAKKYQKKEKELQLTRGGSPEFSSAMSALMAEKEKEMNAVKNSKTMSEDLAMRYGEALKKLENRDINLEQFLSLEQAVGEEFGELIQATEKMRKTDEVTGAQAALTSSNMALKETIEKLNVNIVKTLGIGGIAGLEKFSAFLNGLNQVVSGLVSLAVAIGSTYLVVSQYKNILGQVNKLLPESLAKLIPGASAAATTTAAAAGGEILDAIPPPTGKNTNVTKGSQNVQKGEPPVTKSPSNVKPGAKAVVSGGSGVELGTHGVELGRNSVGGPGGSGTPGPIKGPTVPKAGGLSKSFNFIGKNLGLIGTALSVLGVAYLATTGEKKEGENTGVNATKEIFTGSSVTGDSLIGSIFGFTKGGAWDEAGGVIGAGLMSGITGAMIGTAAGGGPWGTVIGAVVGIFAEISKVITSETSVLGKWLTSNIPGFALLKEFLNGVFEAFDWFYKDLEPVFTELSTSLGEIWGSVSGIFTDIGSVLVTLLGDVFGTGGVSKDMKGFGKTIGNVLGAIFSAIVRVVNEIMAGVNLLMKIVRVIINVIVKFVGAFLGTIFGAVASIIKIIYNIFNLIYQLFFGDMASKKQALIDLGKSIFGLILSIGTPFSQLIDEVIAMLTAGLAGRQHATQTVNKDGSSTVRTSMGGKEIKVDAANSEKSLARANAANKLNSERTISDRIFGENYKNADAVAANAGEIVDNRNVKSKWMDGILQEYIVTNPDGSKKLFTGKDKVKLTEGWMKAVKENESWILFGDVRSPTYFDAEGTRKTSVGSAATKGVPAPSDASAPGSKVSTPAAGASTGKMPGSPEVKTVIPGKPVAQAIYDNGRLNQAAVARMATDENSEQVAKNTEEVADNTKKTAEALEKIIKKMDGGPSVNKNGSTAVASAGGNSSTGSSPANYYTTDTNGFPNKLTREPQQQSAMT